MPSNPGLIAGNTPGNTTPGNTPGTSLPKQPAQPGTALADGGMLCIGLMSGTSLDGIDGVLARFSDSGAVDVLAHAAQPFDAALASTLLALNTPGDNEIHRVALAANALAAAYAEVVSTLLAATRLAPGRIAAIGAHGQTVRHRPGEFDGVGYSVQLNHAALLAERTGITVVSDFRSRDIAAGGQGAPLVPAFHRAVFGRPGRTTAVVNIGGIANLSVLGAAGEVIGFDCGPGNALLDAWCRQHTGQPFDRDGAWGAGGIAVPALLERMRQEPYFAAPAPKSTGRDLFHPGWLAAHLDAHLATQPVSTAAAAAAAAADVQATLVELTATTIADAVHRYASDSDVLIVCGGGAFNLHLVERLQAALPETAVSASDRHGMPALQVEAAAFAWLARAALLRTPGNHPAVTGARGSRVLGAIHLA